MTNMEHVINYLNTTTEDQKESSYNKQIINLYKNDPNSFNKEMILDQILNHQSEYDTMIQMLLDSGGDDIDIVDDFFNYGNKKETNAEEIFNILSGIKCVYAHAYLASKNR